LLALGNKEQVLQERMSAGMKTLYNIFIKKSRFAFVNRIFCFKFGKIGE
jgi:hypothetical protein